MHRNWLLERTLRFLRDEDGPAAVEYAMLILLVFLACLVAIGSVGQATSDSLGESSKAVNQAVGAGP